MLFHMDDLITRNVTGELVVWEPISMAPLDGRWFMCCRVNEETGEPSEYMFKARYDGRVFVDDQNTLVLPTHWTPMRYVN